MNKMNKKGEAGEMIHWTFRLFFAIVLLLFLLAQIYMLLGEKGRPDHMELALYQQRLLQGPNGIFLHEGERVLLGVLDLERMQGDEVPSGVYEQEAEYTRFGARIRIYDDAHKVGSDDFVKEIYHEKDMTRTYLPLAEAGLSGKGGGVYERHLFPVIAEENGKTFFRWLLIETVMRK